MKWSEAERVGTANPALILIFAVLDGAASGFGPILYVEYALLAVLFELAAAHGAYSGGS